MLSEFTTNVVSKQEIEQKSKEANQLELGKEMSKLSKVKHLVGEEFEKKGYLENRNIAQAGVKFSERVNMFYCKMNYRNDPVFKEQCWTCDSCQSAIDDMSHVMVCATYQPLRQDKNMNGDGVYMGHYDDRFCSAHFFRNLVERCGDGDRRTMQCLPVS